MVELSTYGSGEGHPWVTGGAYSTCARHGAQRQGGAVNRGAKAKREVTWGCKSPGGLDVRNS